MNLSRRGFLGLLATGAVGACVASKIPTAWLPEPVRRYAACEFMRTEFNAFCGGRMDDMPERLRAGTALYEAYESELVVNLRFCAAEREAPVRRTLMFKGVALWEDAALAPWDFALEGPRGVTVVRMRPTMGRAA